MRVFIWPYRAVCLKGWCHIGIYNAASAVVRDFTRTDITGGDYTLLLSRLIAGFQISITVWLGVSLLKEELAGQKSLAFYLAMLSSHTL